MSRIQPEPSRYSSLPRRGAKSSPQSTQPLFYHPAVSISLVTIVACAVQLAVWLINARQPQSWTPPTASPAVHGFLYEVLRLRTIQWFGDSQAEPALFMICLCCALSSVPAWYLAARVGLGVRWATWTALLWAIHPAFAALAQRTGPVALLLIFTPLSLATLLWWRQRPRFVPALAAGFMLGLVTLVGLQSLLLYPAMLVALLCAAVPPRRRALGVVFVCIGWALTVWGALIGCGRLVNPARVTAKVQQDLRRNFDELAVPRDEAGSRDRTGSQTGSQPGQAPHASALDMAARFADRLGGSVYATADRKFQKPLFTTYALLIVPALWGAVVAWRHRPWRWLASACTAFIFAFWLTAAIAAPLAREAVPAGGALILLALIGLADVYERWSGRRLAGPTP